MLHYRVAKAPDGHYFATATLAGTVPPEELYRDWSSARQTADWRNGVPDQEPNQLPTATVAASRASPDG